MIYKSSSLVMRISYILFLSGMITLLLSCGKDKSIPDVSHIETPLQIYHFSQDLFSIDTTEALSQVKELKRAYPTMFPLYFTNIVPILRDTTLNAFAAREIKRFIQDSSIVAIYDTTRDIYADFSHWEREFDKLNKYMKYYFPEEKTPSYYTMITEYAFGAFIFEDTLQRDGIGIGLDMFLGPEYDYRSRNPYSNSFSNYLVWKYTPDFIVKAAADVWISDKLTPPRDNRLLDLLLHEGKKIYIAEQLLPHTADTVLFSYPPEQLAWVKENELNIWAHLLSEKLIYTRDNGKIIRLINPAPSTSEMTTESPGQAALYCGYKIIDNYMKLHPEVSLKELTRLTDAQKILTDARYKPK